MRRIFIFFRKLLKQYSSPVFLLLLFLSTALWYVTKLSYSYTTQLPVSVNIEGNNFKVYCVAEGTGYRLFAHRFFFRQGLDIRLKDIETAPSIVNKDSYVINPFSLQNAISLKNGDIRIISVGELPEITIIKQE